MLKSSKLRTVLACAAIAAALVCGLGAGTGAAATEGGAAAGLPTRFDLRDTGVVGPIRNQQPWGTCWTMAASAASETSILSEQGALFADTGLTFSPRHTTWFAGTALPDAETMQGISSEAAYASQAGEGTYIRSTSDNVHANPMENGGHSFTVACLYASGAGPVLEQDAPYQNNEGIASMRDRSDEDWEWKGIGELAYGQTIDEFLAEHPDGDYYAFTQVDEEGYDYPYRCACVVATPELAAKGYLAHYAAEPIFDADGYFIPYPSAETPEYDWSLPEEQRFSRTYELEEYVLLPQPTGGFEGDEYVYDESVTEAIKRELLAGRGVSARIVDDSWGVEWGRSNYTNADTWSQYSVDHDDPTRVLGSNHAVCIVGWDDEWSAENFIKVTYGDEGEEIVWMPPADGAWIVRNSYGADGAGFPNEGSVGYLDEEGNHTGYFYVSYYDASISYPASFNFDTTGHISDYIDQYDLMPAPVPHTEDYDVETRFANVFAAEGDQLIHALSVETEEQDTHAVLSLVRLGESGGIEGSEVAATVEADFAYAGFHRVELDERVAMAAGERFCVVCELTTRAADGSQTWHVPMHRDVNEAAVEKYGDAITSYVRAVVNPGESLLSQDGSWLDWSELIAQGKADGSLVAEYDYDNFALKAYADEDTSPQPQPGPEPEPTPTPTPEPTPEPTPQPEPQPEPEPAQQPATDKAGTIPATGDESASALIPAFALLGIAFVAVRACLPKTKGHRTTSTSAQA